MYRRLVFSTAHILKFQRPFLAFGSSIRSFSSKETSAAFKSASSIEENQRQLTDRPEYAFTDIPVPKRVVRENETRQVKIARLTYQSRKRGILESDLLCSTFAEKYLETLSNEQLSRYDVLLDENDWDLYYWTAGEKEPPAEIANNDVFKLMCEHFKNEGRQILKMPDLSVGEGK